MMSDYIIATIIQCYEADLQKVQQNGCALQFVKEQTYELCLAAVQKNGWALKFVKEQTYELCLAAVQQYGLALQEVKDPLMREKLRLELKL